MATEAERLADALGGVKVLRTRPRTVDGLRQRVRAGLPFASVLALANLCALDLRTLARVIAVPERTIARRRQEGRLQPDESDRVARVARVVTLAADALGGAEAAGRWLVRPNRALGGVVPLEELDTDIGVRKVEAVLGRIAHGVYS